MSLVSEKNRNLRSVATALKYSGIETPEERRQVIKRINFYANPSLSVAQSFVILSVSELIITYLERINSQPYSHALACCLSFISALHGLNNFNKSFYLVKNAKEIVSEQRRRLSKDYVQDNRSDGETDLSTYLDKAKSFGLGGILR